MPSAPSSARLVPVLIAALLCAPASSAQIFPVEIGTSLALARSSSSAGDANGFAVAQVGSWSAVGAPGFSGSTGHVDLFEKVGETWVGPTVLSAPAPAMGHGFGRALTGDGDTLVVGAPQGSFPATGPGRVHVYVLSGSSWQLQATLVADDGVFGDQFGRALDLDGDRLVIGAPFDDLGALQTGAVYVFDRVGSSWSQTALLTAPVPEAGSQFGRAVSVDGDSVLVGAWLANTSGADSGTGFVFVDQGGGQFVHQAQLVSSSGAAGDHMGESVQLIGDIALLGASFADEIALNAGAVRRFNRSGTTWTAGTFPKPITVASGDAFGRSLAYGVTEGLLLVGSPDEAVGTPPTDSVYVFDVEDGVITEHVRLLGIGATSDEYGRAVAVGPQALLGGGSAAESGAGNATLTPLVKVGFFEDLGLGFPGTNGVPVLTGTGKLIGLTPYSYNLTGALPSAFALLIVGLSRIDVPFKQGTLVPSVDFILAVPVQANGTASVGGDWPDDPPGPFSIYLQWWIKDPGAQEGFAASNALEAVVPPF